MRNTCLALVLLCCFSRCRATTVVVAVTPGGIVIGADGKGFPTGTIRKIRLLKRRLVVADLYLELAERKDQGTKAYDFPTWVENIDEHTNAEVSVTGLTEIIERQLPTTFNFAINAIKSGELPKEEAIAHGIDVYLVQYVIAGYENGIPTVCSLTLMPDWDTKTVNGPFQVPLKEENGERADSHILYRGRGIGIEHAKAANSSEQRELAARAPVEFNILKAGKSLTLQQASNMVRSLLGIEAKAEPNYVGLPFTVVTVPKFGNGWARTYKTDASPVSALPKANTGKEK
jgi:hypothetical protein